MRDEDTQNEAKINLARRAVACRRWRWMPGMRYRIVSCEAWGWLRASERPEHLASLNERSAGDEELLPDLDDPATLGCLLALVREAWGSRVSIVCTDAGWAMRLQGGAVGLPELVQGGGDPWHATEVEAAVAALEAAPRREALVAALEAAP